jgi:hypothetical protein
MGVMMTDRYYLVIEKQVSLEPYRKIVADKKAKALEKTLGMTIEIVHESKIERKGKQ